MQLTLPDILRFKGRNAATHCDEWARELHGRCKREGNTLILTRTVKVKVEAAPAARLPDPVHALRIFGEF